MTLLDLVFKLAGFAAFVTLTLAALQWIGHVDLEDGLKIAYQASLDKKCASTPRVKWSERAIDASIRGIK